MHDVNSLKCVNVCFMVQNAPCALEKRVLCGAASSVQCSMPSPQWLTSGRSVVLLRRPVSGEHLSVAGRTPQTPTVTASASPCRSLSFCSTSEILLLGEYTRGRLHLLCHGCRCLPGGTPRPEVYFVCY